MASQVQIKQTSNQNSILSSILTWTPSRTKYCSGSGDCWATRYWVTNLVVYIFCVTWMGGEASRCCLFSGWMASCLFLACVKGAEACAMQVYMDVMNGWSGWSWKYAKNAASTTYNWCNSSGVTSFQNAMSLSHAASLIINWHWGGHRMTFSSTL